MACAYHLVMIDTQILPLVVRWLCTALWSQPMITSISGQICPAWRRLSNTPTALVIGALFAMQCPYVLKLGICRVYASLANFYSVQTKLFIGQPRVSCLHVAWP